MSVPVASSHFPYLTIHGTIRQPATGSHRELQIKALVDTGFDGGVVIPKDRLDPSLTPVRYLPWSLADDSQVLLPAFLGDVRIGTLPPVRTIIMPLGDEPLLGRHVTNHFRILLDHGTQITVEP
jgi:predicted aspartyl protease